MSSSLNTGDLPEAIARVHQIATLIAGLQREEAAAAGIPIGATSTAAGPPPATRAAIEALPRVVVTGEAARRNCPICLEDATVGTEVKEMPCKHGFHPDCLAGWLVIRGSCPVCRYVMGERPDPIIGGSG